MASQSKAGGATLVEEPDTGTTTSTGPGRDPASRAAAGQAARAVTPLESHAELPDRPDRADPIAILAAQATTRVPELVPIRHGRMSLSPFTFYRGAAAVMAADLAGTPSSGLVTHLCGDAHLSNFGVFASPERRMMFDINDFDETYPGPWEWDVKRLAASLVVASRENGFNRKARASVVLATVGRYREAMTQFAGMGELDVWYSRADLDELGPELASQLSKARRKQWSKRQAKARTRSSLQAMSKLSAVVDGRRRIIADPPLVVPVEQLMPEAAWEELETQIAALVTKYRRTLQTDRRHLLDAFTFVDMARKVVGVGSVGTRCWILLLTGRDDNDPLLLQAKEAQPSVLAKHVTDRRARTRYRSDGQRVVHGQRLMQAASDIFLGWETVEGIDGQRRDFYIRQLRDWKGSAIIEDMDPPTMRLYGSICGWTLARAHARGGDRIAIAGYLGDSDAFDRALVEFSERYADRTERDFAALTDAIATGRLEAQKGV
jgi:uncharacterized protein (DUF2252 family)